MIQHTMRTQKFLNNKIPEQLKIWNFIGTIKSNEPKIIWVTSEEVNELKKWEDNNIVWINHAFNPLFHSLSQKRKNIELFFRIDDTWFLPLILERLWYHIKYDRELTNEYSTIIPEWINSSMNNHNKTAYVPISSWCNQFCAYCIVPYARWLEKRFPVDQIVKEAKNYVNHWVKEISLLWQIVNKHPDFITIIKELLKIDGLKRLRYTSPYPTYYSDELLKLHENEEKLCPHIHIPFQSWSTNVLKKMFRWYTAEQCYEFIDKIRDLKRDISITTDIILWFPWETEEDFDKTLKLTEYWKFDMIYMWIYSNRPGTFADRKYPDNIPYKVKHERWNKLNNLLYKISEENNKKEEGNIRNCMVNEIGNNWEYYWVTDNMKQITITPSKLWKPSIWDIIPVKISKGVVFKLEGDIVEKQ
jgi:tRNA-2-methylthio-N6-dimethylallyladenosine synthase